MKNVFRKLFGNSSSNSQNISSYGEDIIDEDVPAITEAQETELKEKLIDACKNSDAEQVSLIFSAQLNSTKTKLLEIKLAQKDGTPVPLLNWVMNKLAFDDTKSDAYVSIAKTLVINGADYTLRVGQWGSSPISSAVFGGYTDILKSMIEMGADMLNTEKYRSKYEDDYIFQTSEKGHLDIVNLFINKGVDINKTSNSGYTALHSAAFYNRIEVVKFLVSNKANVNLRENGGQTPISIAANKGFEEIVEILLKNGADPTIKDNKGYSAINYATSSVSNILLNNVNTNFLQKLTENIEDKLKSLINRKDYDPSVTDDYKSKIIIEQLADDLISCRLQVNPNLLVKIKELFYTEPWLLTHLFKYVRWDDMGCKSVGTISLYNQICKINSDYGNWFKKELELLN